MMDMTAKTKLTDDMKMVPLTSGITTGSLLFGELQRKWEDSLCDFLSRAKELINLEDAYAQAYGVLLEPIANTTTAQTLQMNALAIFPSETSFTTPIVYRQSTSM
uniref:Uncharacterized protein n=1 Tax=Cannabis sativa TaxID=3483 RepID=A0A803QNK8_CANSA